MKTTSNVKWPQNIKSGISMQQLYGPWPMSKCWTFYFHRAVKLHQDRTTINTKFSILYVFIKIQNPANFWAILWVLAWMSQDENIIRAPKGKVSPHLKRVVLHPLDSSWELPALRHHAGIVLQGGHIPHLGHWPLETQGGVQMAVT